MGDNSRTQHLHIQIFNAFTNFKMKIQILYGTKITSPLVK